MKKIFILLTIIFLSRTIIAQNEKYKDLVDQLLIIYNDDQKLRIESDEIETKYGMQSKEVIAVWKQIHINDSINIIKVKAILDKYGWLGADDIGSKCNSTIFLVIQHSNLNTQEKYLPMMREAVKNNRARPSDLALLEDRVALRQGKRQIYGSQVGQNYTSPKSYLLPLQDPDNVDKRRAEVGLQPIAEYLLNWDIVWDVEQYKKEVDVLEASLKAL